MPLTPSRVIRLITLSLLSRISKLLPKISGGRSHFSLKFWASLNPALPSYFVHPEVYTRHMHPLSRLYRQIHISVCYYQYSFFPMSVVLWNKLPADLTLFLILTPLKQESVRSIMCIPKASSPVLFLIGF